jgi:hypothetical protein
VLCFLPNFRTYLYRIQGYSTNRWQHRSHAVVSHLVRCCCRRAPASRPPSPLLVGGILTRTSGASSCKATLDPRNNALSMVVAWSKLAAGLAMILAAESKTIPTSLPTETTLIQYYDKGYTGTIPVREPTTAQRALADAVLAHTILRRRRARTLDSRQTPDENGRSLCHCHCFLLLLTSHFTLSLPRPATRPSSASSPKWRPARWLLTH